MEMDKKGELLNEHARITLENYSNQMMSYVGGVCAELMNNGGTVSLTLSMTFERDGDCVLINGKIKKNKTDSFVENLDSERVDLNQRVLDLRTAEGKSNE